MKKITFNDNWIFSKQGFTDTRPVTLPHDAMIHEQRAPENPSGSAGAFFPGGKYVYEKTFPRPEAAHVLLQFEGVYKNARVFLNGKEAGGAAYGYIPFFVCADDYLIDGENTVRVECENQNQPDSRWYSGAGIYRPVWLWEGPEDSIVPESVKISTVSYAPAVIRVTSPEPVKVNVGGVSGEGTDFQLSLPDAKPWSDTTPNLYTAHVTNGIDNEDIRFGIRKIEWSSKGLFINGKETLLRGGCIHHDGGILGAAACDVSEYRRVRKMKEAGFNAIRSAHNPASRAMLEACDELGMYVMDETWDMWYSHKSKFDYAGEFPAHYKSDLRAMVNRDFNHPSVIMYSIGNEVSEPAQEKGVKLAQEMVDYLHGLDQNRAVTGGMNLMIIARSAKGNGVYKEDGGRDDGGKQNAMNGMSSTMFNMVTSMVGTGMNKGANGKKADAVTSPVLDALDIAGYNYASGRYPLEGKAHPDRVIFGSETFPQDIWKNWQMVKQYPYLVGDFMWTAWDYLGEAGIGAWAYTPDGKSFDKPYPWLLADVGALDLLGDPNGELFLAQAGAAGEARHRRPAGESSGREACQVCLAGNQRPAQLGLERLQRQQGGGGGLRQCRRSGAAAERQEPGQKESEERQGGFQDTICPRQTGGRGLRCLRAGAVPQYAAIRRRKAPYQRIAGSKDGGTWRNRLYPCLPNGRERRGGVQQRPQADGHGGGRRAAGLRQRQSPDGGAV